MWRSEEGLKVIKIQSLQAVEPEAVFAQGGTSYF